MTRKATIQVVAIVGPNIGRVVIINFDDSYKSQYVHAKLILDKYGFKATFFAVCDWIGASDTGENTKNNTDTCMYKPSYSLIG